MTTNKVFGYARVSSKEQNLDRQILELKNYIEDERNIFIDKQSGKDFNRSAYQALLHQLRQGDLLIILSIDRLGRNYEEIQNQWRILTKEIGIDIKVLDMPLLDTSIDNNSLDSKFVADLVLQILSYVSEKERANIKARQRSGIDIALNKGIRFGRTPIEYPTDFEKVYKDWKNDKITAVKAMTELNLKKNTFYNLVKKYESK